MRLGIGGIRWSSIAGAVLVALSMVGCAGRGNVSGKVTYQNKTVPWGTILIEGSDGGHRQGSIEKDGTFYVEDLATGEAKVAVNSPNPKSITMMAKGDRPPQKFPDVPGWFAIPTKYEAVDKSGLVYTIKKGENKIDIELK
jgi:hypothetical protein